MQWLISNIEPEAVHAPILVEELLQDGIMREIVDHLPWYKKTRNMDVILARHLVQIIRSGFERSFVVKEMETLDVPRDVAKRFLHVLEARGYCRFGEPRYLYGPLQFVSPLTKGVAVQSRYGRRRVVISAMLAECLQFLGGPMPREKYQEILVERLGREEYAEQACLTLARQGLLLSCDSTETPVSDYGVLCWNLEIEHQGELLSELDWEERLNFLEESFRGFYFQSHNCFSSPPVKLCGHLDTIARVGNAEYFWELSFKLQRFAQQVPIILNAARFSAYDCCDEMRLQSPTLFDLGFTIDLRADGNGVIAELLAYLQNRRFSYVPEVTLLLGQEWPASLNVLNEHVRLKLYSTDAVQIPPVENMPPALRHVVEQYLKPHGGHEGCGAMLSLYIDGKGDVYSCSLEHGVRLGHIADGARVIEQSRRSLRQSRRAHAASAQ